MEQILPGGPQGQKWASDGQEIGPKTPVAQLSVKLSIQLTAPKQAFGSSAAARQHFPPFFALYTRSFELPPVVGVPQGPIRV
jgi:hypothetical protein